MSCPNYTRLPILDKKYRFDWKVTDGNLDDTNFICDDTLIKLTDPKNHKLLTKFLNTKIPWGSPMYPLTPNGTIILKLPDWTSISPDYAYLEFTPDLLPTNKHFLGAIYTFYHTPLSPEELKKSSYFESLPQTEYYAKQRGGTIKMVDLNLDHVFYEGVIDQPSPGVYEIFFGS